MGLECFEPQGAFYMFPSIESTGLSSDEFCERLLHEQEVAVIPGSAFRRERRGPCAYLVFVLDEPSERGLQQDS